MTEICSLRVLKLQIPYPGALLINELLRMNLFSYSDSCSEWIYIGNKVLLQEIRLGLGNTSKTCYRLTDTFDGGIFFFLYSLMR